MVFFPKSLVLSFVFACSSACVSAEETDVERLLKEYLKSRPAERLAAMKKMTSIAKNVRPAMMVIREGLLDREEEIRFEALSALSTLTSAYRSPSADASSVTTVLTKPGQNRRVRLQCITLLGLIGPRGGGSSTLAKILIYDEDMALRRAAAHALGAIGKQPRYAVPALIEALKSDDRTEDPNEMPLSQAAARAWAVSAVGHAMPFRPSWR